MARPRKGERRKGTFCRELCVERGGGLQKGERSVEKSCGESVEKYGVVRRGVGEVVWGMAGATGNLWLSFGSKPQ
jgi:hypothetical protein